MKKTWLALAGLLTLWTTGGQAQMTPSKTLIAYYSWSGNTRAVAEEIQKQTGGTLFEIQTVTPYPAAYQATVDQAKKEIADGYRPALVTPLPDVAGYDVVFVGSPNWWGTIAPAVSSFLAAENLSGKTVVPFITHGGGYVQNTVKDLTTQCTGCQVAEAYVGYGTSSPDEKDIQEWLEKLSK